jgi:hypothetical protein
MEMRRQGCYLAGRRVMLGDGLSRLICDESVDWRRMQHFPSLLYFWLRYAGGRHLVAGLYLPRILRLRTGQALKLKGCNLSFWKQDVERINGFEETFEMPCGGEDTDLERRFKAIGLTSRSVKHASICYHLHHPLLPRDGRAGMLCRELEKQGTVQALRGIAGMVDA